MSDAVTKYEKATPKVKKHLELVNKCLAVAEAMKIENEDDYGLAADRLAASKDHRSVLEAYKEEICGPLHKIHKAAVAAFKPALENWKKCESVLNRKLADYDVERERRAQEEAKRLEELAEREAERERSEAEEKARAAEADGDPERAEEIRERAKDATVIVMPLPRPAPPKVEGLKAPTSVWKYEVVDIDKVPMTFCNKVVDGELVRAYAKKTEGKKEIAGIRIWKETVRSKG